MALPLDRPTRVDIRVADPWRSFDFRSPGRIAPVRLAVGLVGRGLAVGMGAGVLLSGPSAASLTFIGVLALGAALVSWDQ
jgi:hypothetical protein